MSAILSLLVLIVIAFIAAFITIAAMIGAAHRGPCEDNGSTEAPWMPPPVAKQKALKDRLEARQRVTPPKPPKMPKTKYARVPDDKIRSMHWADEADTEASHG